ncbi:hypothetical protein [Aquabacter spiritensis]|uniref:UrcA family protein n=1 Tax=Aquabacter spiritensis TaxID=933073 RepID=A0A4R3LQ81_9HYPH|nr:hypothetical protein [Aquabacter spiritensis]TCT02572.1 hypothetical protein EDC64_1125 [Aquabacter spiritensis]
MRRAVLLPVLLLLAGCTTGPSPTPTIVATAPAGAADATGGAGGCAAALVNFQRVIDADKATGHLNAAVHARMTGDLGAVRTACQAGHDAQARAELATIRARYGYP